MLNNKGQSEGMPKWLIWLLIIGVIFLVISLFIKTDFFSSLIEKGKGISAETQVSSVLDNSPIFKYLTYIFGEVPTFLVEKTNEISALIIIIALWFLILVTFSDILTTFGTFNKNTSWIIGLAIAVIAANLKWIVSVSIFFVGIFAFMGTLSVFIGMFSAFFAFVVVNWGIGRFGPWIFRRKMMQSAAKEEVRSEAGAKKVASFIKGAKEGADAFSK
jgi:hypothetical protein